MTALLRFAVVVARFNSLVTKPLLEGAEEIFHRHGVDAANLDVRGRVEGWEEWMQPTYT